MIPDIQINNPLVIDNDWSQEFQLVNIYDGVDAGRSQIALSDTSNPCIVKTILAHNLSSGKVCIDGHTPNVIINGNQTIAIVDAFTFTITGVTGQIAGNATGIVEQVINASTYTGFTIAAKQTTVGTPLTHPVFTLTWVDQSIFDFILSVTAAESAQVIWQSAPLVVTVSWQNAGKTDSVDLFIPLQNG